MISFLKVLKNQISTFCKCTDGYKGLWRLVDAKIKVKKVFAWLYEITLFRGPTATILTLRIHIGSLLSCDPKNCSESRLYCTLVKIDLQSSKNANRSMAEKKSWNRTSDAALWKIFRIISVLKEENFTFIFLFIKAAKSLKPICAWTESHDLSLESLEKNIRVTAHSP
jgi:hypothetical protein